MHGPIEAVISGKSLISLTLSISVPANRENTRSAHSELCNENPCAPRKDLARSMAEKSVTFPEGAKQYMGSKGDDIGKFYSFVILLI
jgi:hypothetical protein